MGKDDSWQTDFSSLFKASVLKYQGGRQKPGGLVDEAGARLLKSIGHTEQEFFDFVDDFSRGGEPALETALEIAAVRRDYFLNVQHGQTSSQQIDMAKLPSKDAEVDGIGWLPRLLPKAAAKLKGEMPPDLMFGCGGDRKFFRTNTINAAEFLRQVWNAGDNTDQVVEWVKKTRKIAA